MAHRFSEVSLKNGYIWLSDGTSIPADLVYFEPNPRGGHVSGTIYSPITSVGSYTFTMLRKQDNKPQTQIIVTADELPGWNDFEKRVYGLGSK